MKKNFLLAASFLFIFCLEAGAQKRDEVTWEKFEDITIPIPPSTHPRLYVRPANLPDLKKRMDHPQVKANLATLRKLGIDRTAEEGKSNRQRLPLLLRDAGSNQPCTSTSSRLSGIW